LKQDVSGLKQDVLELKKGQAALEAAINDLRAANRRTHKEIFSQLNAMWKDIKQLTAQDKKAADKSACNDR
ncbi:hypothetical protein, partial [Desulfotomaculum copahuensis]|uniref:hypothetical protein n=1 Tax=Desulfotomaculum copahuensis TaxID=1838280 RepID=UPI000A60D5F0